MNTKEIAKAINWLDGYIARLDDEIATVKTLRKIATRQLPKDAIKVINHGNVWLACDDCATLITTLEDVDLILDGEDTIYCPGCGQRLRIPVEDEE